MNFAVLCSDLGVMYTLLLSIHTILYSYFLLFAPYSECCIFTVMLRCFDILLVCVFEGLVHRTPGSPLSYSSGRIVDIESASESSLPTLVYIIIAVVLGFIIGKFVL